MKDKEFDKNLQKAITASERKKQKRFLKSVEASLNDVDAKPKKVNWLVAASIIAIISLCGYFILNNNGTSNQELYAENFTPYRNIVVPIVRDNIKKSKKNIAFTKYEIGDYFEAILLFNQLEKQDSLDANTINFYKANAYLKIGKTNEAIESLLQISENSNWQEERLWYLALASLKIEKTKDAKKYLSHLKITNKKDFKAKEVDELLKELN